MISLIAQTTAPADPASQPAQPPPGMFEMLRSMGPFLLLFIVMYLFLFRPKSNEKKQREKMLSAMKKGDRVQTIGGILGTVIEVRDGDVLLKVDENSNTKMRFVRSAIARVVEEEKSESK